MKKTNNPFLSNKLGEEGGAKPGIEVIPSWSGLFHRLGVPVWIHVPAASGAARAEEGIVPRAEAGTRSKTAGLFLFKALDHPIGLLL